MIIVIEGPDQVGKATQTKMLAEMFRFLGSSVAQVEIPFKDPLIHPLIYWMLANGSAKKYPNLFQFVQFLNKFIFQTIFLLPLMLNSDFIILDRWSISSIVYGDATGVNKTFNRFLFWFLVKADYTFILTGKTYKRNDAQDVYEKDDSLQRAVRIGYVDWVLENPEGHFLISNEGTKKDVHNRLTDALVENGVPELLGTIC